MKAIACFALLAVACAGCLGEPPNSSPQPTSRLDSKVLAGLRSSVVLVAAASRGMCGYGVVVGPDLVLTSFAGVEDDEPITINVAGEPKAKVRGIVAWDRDTDLALLRADMKGCPSVTFGNAATVRPEDPLWVVMGGLNAEPDVGSGTNRGRVMNGAIHALSVDLPKHGSQFGAPLVDAKGNVVAMVVYHTGDGLSMDLMGFIDDMTPKREAYLCAMSNDMKSMIRSATDKTLSWAEFRAKAKSTPPRPIEAFSDYPLAKLRQVKILVESVSESGTQIGLTRTGVESFVDRELSKAGVLEAVNNADVPTLYVQILIAPYREPSKEISGYFGAVSIGVYRAVPGPGPSSAQERVFGTFEYWPGGATLFRTGVDSAAKDYILDIVADRLGGLAAACLKQSRKALRAVADPKAEAAGAHLGALDYGALQCGSLSLPNGPSGFTNGRPDNATRRQGNRSPAAGRPRLPRFQPYPLENSPNSRC